MLTQERLRELLHYEPETGVFTNIKARPKIRVGSISGCKNAQGYLIIMCDGKLYLAHRLAWLYVHGSFPEHHIDHINRDRADNRISNIREATPAENRQNASLQRNSTSGFSGVSWTKRERRWRARIVVNSREIGLGYFVDKQSAADAYAEAKKQFHPFGEKSYADPSY